MPVHLLFLFVFQSGLAFAFTLFIAKILLKGESDAGPLHLIAGMRKLRNIIAVVTLILPPAMFFAYYHSLPDGQSTGVAIWPSAWIFMILLALVLALTVAMNQHDKHSGRA